MISVTDLCFSRADGDQVQTLFDGFSFEVSAQEQVALLGDSGSGKTTPITPTRWVAHTR